MSRAKNPKYESMSLEELKANMEKSKKELEQAIHNMLEKTQKEQADIKKELSQNQSVLNTEKNWMHSHSSGARISASMWTLKNWMPIF